MFSFQCYHFCYILSCHFYVIIFVVIFWYHSFFISRNRDTLVMKRKQSPYVICCIAKKRFKHKSWWKIVLGTSKITKLLTCLRTQRSSFCFGLERGRGEGRGRGGGEWQTIPDLQSWHVVCFPSTDFFSIRLIWHSSAGHPSPRILETSPRLKHPPTLPPHGPSTNPKPQKCLLRAKKWLHLPRLYKPCNFI
jgi:hypothetical protein